MRDLRGFKEQQGLLVLKDPLDQKDLRGFKDLWDSPDIKERLDPKDLRESQVPQVSLEPQDGQVLRVRSLVPQGSLETQVRLDRPA